MAAAGLLMESARGECHPGQYEIVFRYADAPAACDNHVFYKTGVKAIAAQEGMAVTFMPRYDGGDGNSCHVHLSVRSLDGSAVFADAGRPFGMSALMEHFVAGQLACLPELTVLFAPTVNAYKRLRPGGFAPTVASWGPDDRTAAVRVLGEGPSLRLEHRVGGGDANPYLAVAAILAAGLHGIEHALPLPPSRAEAAAAGASAGAPLPRTLRDAATRFAASEVARKAFGDAVVDHYAHAAEVEADAFDDAVTDWERHRGFERR
jgi:glutamine synthetase